MASKDASTDGGMAYRSPNTALPAYFILWSLGLVNPTLHTVEGQPPRKLTMYREPLKGVTGSRI